jgi:hypothetical protein
MDICVTKYLKIKDPPNLRKLLADKPTKHSFDGFEDATQAIRLADSDSAFVGRSFRSTSSA